MVYVFLKIASLRGVSKIFLGCNPLDKIQFLQLSRAISLKAPFKTFHVDTKIKFKPLDKSLTWCLWKCFVNQVGIRHLRTPPPPVSKIYNFCPIPYMGCFEFSKWCLVAITSPTPSRLAMPLSTRENTLKEITVNSVKDFIYMNWNFIKYWFQHYQKMIFSRLSVLI